MTSATAAEARARGDEADGRRAGEDARVDEDRQARGRAAAWPRRPVSAYATGTSCRTAEAEQREPRDGRDGVRRERAQGEPARADDRTAPEQPRVAPTARSWSPTRRGRGSGPR